MGMNSPGATRPSRGCCQRTSTSAPVNRPRTSTCGCRYSRSSPARIAWRSSRSTRKRCSAAWPMPCSKKATPPPPACLARCSAVPARRSASCAPSPAPCGYRVMPMLAPSCTSPASPPRCRGCRSRACSLPEKANAWRPASAASAPRPPSTTANSSPATRTSRPCGGSRPDRRCATAHSRRSPISLPRASLKLVKRSRSSSISACWCGSAPRKADRRATSAARLGRLVSVSRCASRWISAAVRSASRTRRR